MTYFFRVVLSRQNQETIKPKSDITHPVGSLVTPVSGKETFSYVIAAMANDGPAREVERTFTSCSSSDPPLFVVPAPASETHRRRSDLYNPADSVATLLATPGQQ